MNGRPVPHGRAITLNRPLIVGLAGVASVAALLAVAAGFEGSRTPRQREAVGDVKPKALALPDLLARLPDGYADIPKTAPLPPVPPASPPSAVATLPSELQARIGQLETRLSNLQQTMAGLQSGIDSLQRAVQAPPLARPPVAEPVVDPSRTSSIFFSSGTPSRGQGATVSTAPVNGAMAVASDRQRPSGASSSDLPPSAAPRAEASVPTRNHSHMVSAGTVIPTNLITGINSDLQGDVVAQVRENVYDSVSGRYLLIPQGSKLVGRYDSDIAFGQDRVRLVFTQLVRPDGVSIPLANLGATGADGTAGVGDQVENHWGSVVVGALLSATLSIGIQSSQGNVQGFYPSVGQQAGASAATGVSDVGRNFAQRELARKPTVLVRPGYSFNVVVQRDVALPLFERG